MTFWERAWILREMRLSTRYHGPGFLEKDMSYHHKRSIWKASAMIYLEDTIYVNIVFECSRSRTSSVVSFNDRAKTSSAIVPDDILTPLRDIDIRIYRSILPGGYREDKMNLQKAMEKG
ncbi:hypothetical protein PMIN04_003804 [Paraphaeosphaeria minitans]